MDKLFLNFLLMHLVTDNKLATGDKCTILYHQQSYIRLIKMLIYLEILLCVYEAVSEF